MKKLLSLILVAILLMTLVGCNKEESTEEMNTETNTETSKEEMATDSKDKVVVEFWTFNTDFETLIDEYWRPANQDADFDINVTVIPDQVTYMTKLQQSLQTGADAPDVFAMDLSYVKKFVNTPYLADLNDYGLDLSEVVDYTLVISSDSEGAVKGLSNQSTPGGFYYRRSIAEEYLGVTEPEEVQEYVKDWDTFIETARLINEKSNGEVSIVPGITDFINVFLNTREEAWINENNEFVLDDLLNTYFDLSKTLISEDLTENNNQWSEGWYYGMSHDTTLGYFLPAWGHPYVLTQNSTDENGNSTSGDWAVIQGPRPYFHGGTWLGMYADSSVPEEAVSVIEFFTLNEEHLNQLIIDKNDLTAHEGVNEQFYDMESEFLGGQHIIKEFAGMSDGINPTAIGAYDRDIKGLFVEQLTAYANGEKTKEEAIADLKVAVKNAIPNVTID